MPAGIVLTGGGSALPGMAEYAKQHFHLPVAIGRPTEIMTVIDQVVDPSFATVVGLVQWGGKYSAGVSEGGLLAPMQGLLENKNMLKFRKWFKTFLP